MIASRRSTTVLLSLAAGICVLTCAVLGRADDKPKSALYRENISFAQGTTPTQDRNIASDFSWFDKNGKTVSLKSLRGKVVFLNFWGTWCRPCKQELPDIISLQREYEGDVVFVGIAMERPGGDILQNLVTATRELKLTYQIVVGTDELANAYGGLSGIPTTFIIDKNGKISDSRIGMANRAQFEAMLKKVL